MALLDIGLQDSEKELFLLFMSVFSETFFTLMR
jgi:hypothetical protein